MLKTLTHMAICLSLLIPQISWAKSTVELANSAVATLAKSGFERQRMLVKEPENKGLDFVLLRVGSSKRIYDINIFSSKQAYLSISYDEGNNFSKASKFNSLSALLEVVANIEKREQNRRTSSLDINSAAGQDSSSTDDQKAGLAEAAKKKEEDAKKEAGEKAAAALGGVAAAAGGSSESVDGEAAGGSPASDSEIDKKAKDFSGSFAGAGAAGCQSVGISTGDTPGAAPTESSQQAEGGLAAAAKQIAEAAIATGLAQAFAMNGGITGDVKGGLSVDKSGEFAVSSANQSLAQLLAVEGGFASTSSDKKEAILKGILKQIIADEETAITRQYRSIDELFNRFKKWAHSEGLKEQEFLTQLQFLIDNLRMDGSSFAQAAEGYPHYMQNNFLVDTVDQQILINPATPSPEVASRGFFTAAMLYFRSKAANLISLQDELRASHGRVGDLSDEIFEGDAQDRLKAQEKLQRLFQQASEKMESLERLLEENSVAR